MTLPTKTRLTEASSINSIEVNPLDSPLSNHILTIDVEDWYHCLDGESENWTQYEDRVTNSTRYVIDLLEEMGSSATFFVLGDVAKRHPDLVSEIADRGNEVASHGWNHEFVYHQDPSSFLEDVQKSLNLLQDITGQPIFGYRAPYFSITRHSLWALSVLQELGLAYDSSIFPIFNHRYGIPNAPRVSYQLLNGFRELPPATAPVGKVNLPYGGGIYFRFIPWRLLFKFCQAAERRSEKMVFYLHPWEMDPGQPKMQLPVGLRLRHYWSLSQTASKLRSLLGTFQFTSARKAMNL